MRRLVLILVLALPLTAAAKGKKKADPDKVEIWPPSATDEPPPPPKKEEPPPAEPEKGNSKSKFGLDPSLTGEPDDSAPIPKQPSPADADAPKKVAAEPEDPCVDPFEDCKEECTIEHATDDTLHVAKGKKLPVAKCLSRCKKTYDGCEERRAAGFEEEDRGSSEPVPRD